MKITHNNTSVFFREYTFADHVTRKSVHILSFMCWFMMILLGTVVIGVGTANTSLTLPACTDTQAFCTRNILFNTTSTVYFYTLLTGFNQNNRNFLDSYSLKQLRGSIDNTYHCDSYYTYGSLGLTNTAGGYRMPSTAHAHPCGEVMRNIAGDAIYLVDPQGATPQLDSGNLISSYNSEYNFVRLNSYQLSQWVDVKSSQFVNYFTVGLTDTKYILMGVASVTPGDYQLVIQNNYPTKGLFSKQIIVTQIGLLGVTNHFLGFTLFVFGVFLLFAHVVVCFKWRK